MTTTLQGVPSRRRIALAVIIAGVSAGALWMSVFVSNEIGGWYRREREDVRLVAVEGALHAFDRGEHPEIDGFSYDDAEAAEDIRMQWGRAGTRTNIGDRHRALPTRYEDRGHEWIESFDTLSLDVTPLEIEDLGLTLPWIRVVSVAFDHDLRGPMGRLSGAAVDPTGPKHVVIDYLRRHAPHTDLADLVARGLHTYPRHELEPRFVWIPAAQIALVALLSVDSTLVVVWLRRRYDARVPARPSPVRGASRCDTGA
ncbi:MAG TPA: hypothetical protein VFF69_03710 [Phycisphaerales bacterium]|nr:hypothetical protein [Phycisphaerales bacterium]